MVQILPYVYLGYMFISIYFVTFYLLLFIRNRKDMFESPKITKKYTISVLVPAYNEQDTIGNTIKAVFDSKYPVDELIVLDDGSKDDTGKIVKSLLKKYQKLVYVGKENSGKADSLNQGIKLAKSELIAVVDADSYPEKEAFGNLVGFFDDDKVGVATPYIIPRNRERFWEKLQYIEYSVIAFTRKLLGYVDAIYVTPGPLALYRKSALEHIGGFDKNNITEDIEITWHLTKEGYKRKMSLGAVATTTVPSKLKPWITQRRRWNLGGLQCISKYKRYFLRKGMLGVFILPFFILNLFLGLVGLSIFLYLSISRIITNYFYVRSSFIVGSAVISTGNFHYTPSFLNYLGIILFVFGLIYTLLILFIMKQNVMLKKHNFFIFLIYSTIYLMFYPFILVTSLYHYFRGVQKWR